MIYLKCEYKKKGGAIAVFSNEYLIRFKGIKQPYLCIVRRDHVFSQNETTGLVKLVFIEPKKDGTSIVGINDVADHRITRFRVLDEDIVSDR